MVRLPGVGDAQAGPALGRPAPARRARARDRQPAARAAARRAARRARPEAAPGDAGRAQGASSSELGHHVRLRHARPGGGADDERPHRRLQRRAGSSRSARRPRSTSTRRTSSSPASSASRTSLERDGRRFTIRPEKIRMLDDGRAPSPARRRDAAASREVVYLGSVTRYVVELDDGGDARRRAAEPRDLVAARRSSERGRRVRLDVAPGARVRRSNPRGGTQHEEAGRAAPGHCGRWSRRLLVGAGRRGGGGGGARRAAAAIEACRRRSARARASSTSSPGRATPSRSGSSRSRRQTGCKVQREVRRLLGRDGHADAPGRRRRSTTWSRPPATRACA